MTGVRDYSSTAGSNTSVGGVSIAEGMARASVNNAIRAEMADLANLLLDQGGATATTNSSNDYSVTLPTAPTAYANNMLFAATINAANTGASTLNVNSIGVKNVKKMVAGVATALASGDMPAGHIAYFTYSSGNTAIILLNPANTSVANATGTLSVANGGTGATTLTGVLKGNGTSAVTAAAQLAVADGGTGIASGTSGGVPYFSGSTTIASSGALAANQLVLGGGAGTTPATLGSLGTTTTLLHGNAGGAPTFGAVDLANDVSGNLGVSHLNSGTSASNSTFWRGDGTWATGPSGSGFVAGPASATDNALTRFDGTSGTVIQNSGITIDDSNNVSGVGTFSSGTITTSGNLELGNASDTTVARVAAGRASIEGVGVVRGPASATSTGIARYSGTTGDLIQDSGVTIDGSNNVSGVAGLTTTGNIELGNASDTTLSRASAGRLAVEGVNVVTTSSTDTLTNKTLTSPTLTTPALGVATATGLTVNSSTQTMTLGDEAYSQAGFGFPLSVQDTDYTFVLTDAKTIVRHNSASAHAYTIPPNASVAFRNGTMIIIGNIGAGTVTITRGAGVTLTNGSASSVDVAVTQGTAQVIIKLSTNTWMTH